MERKEDRPEQHNANNRKGQLVSNRKVYRERTGSGVRLLDLKETSETCSSDRPQIGIQINTTPQDNSRYESNEDSVLRVNIINFFCFLATVLLRVFKMLTWNHYFLKVTC